MKRIIAGHCLIVTALLWCAITASAQSDRGTISGAVLDSSGGAIPNAEIVLTNVDTQVVTRATANDVGLYLSLIHISEPTRLGMISYAVFCLKKKSRKVQS